MKTETNDFIINAIRKLDWIIGCDKEIYYNNQKTIGLTTSQKAERLLKHSKPEFLQSLNLQYLKTLIESCEKLGLNLDNINLQIFISHKKGKQKDNLSFIGLQNGYFFMISPIVREHESEELRNRLKL